MPPKVHGSLRRASQDLYDNNQGRLKMAMGGGEELFVAARARKFPSPLTIFSPLGILSSLSPLYIVKYSGEEGFPTPEKLSQGNSPLSSTPMLIIVFDSVSK